MEVILSFLNLWPDIKTAQFSFSFQLYRSTSDPLTSCIPCYTLFPLSLLTTSLSLFSRRHLPIGLLHDYYASDSTLPWNITVHFQVMWCYLYSLRSMCFSVSTRVTVDGMPSSRNGVRIHALLSKFLCSWSFLQKSGRLNLTTSVASLHLFPQTVES